MSGHLQIRAYDGRDADAVWDLHEWALADAGTDPADVPGTDDLRRVESAYCDAGGAFLVGTLDDATADGASGDTVPVDVVDGTAARDPPRTFDGRVVAMGGFVPTTVGRADERTVADAAELHRMRVAPTHQRRGYGRTLLHALESRARDAGFDRLLATTASRQTAAVDFYPSEGYREVDRSTAGAYELVHFEKDL